MKQSSIVSVVKKICPAVITIVITKDLPKIDGYFNLPVQGQNLVIPQMNGKKQKTKIGGGSGFIISQDGLVLTSQHVVGDTEADYTVILEPEKQYSAKVLARDSINDIAILKIQDKNLPYLELGDSNSVELGQDVIAIGNALGEFHDTVSKGIVSGLSRNIIPLTEFGKQAEQLRGLIQTDAAINPGNSGGPLTDIQGKVIGINTATVAMAQNIGFAIPINYAKKDLDEVKKFGKIIKPFLGVRYILLNKQIAEKDKLPVDHGAFVIREILGGAAIVENSAAKKAGLKEFDIILECNNQKISVEHPLSNMLQKCEIGQEAELKVLRNNKEQIIKVILEERK